MSKPVSFESPRIDFRWAAPGAEVLRPLLFGLGSSVPLLIGIAAWRTDPIPSALLVLAATGLWLAGPAKKLVDPLLIRAFPPKPGAVQAANGALVVTRGKTRRAWNGHDIAEARLYPLTRELHLRHASGKGIQLHLPSPDAAIALLDALAVPAHKRVHVARLGLDPAKRLTPWLLAGIASVITATAFLLNGGPALFALWILPFIASIVFAIACSLENLGELAVSREGITLQRVRRSDFLHHGGLREVRVDPDRIRLFTDNGRELGARIEGIDAAGRETIDAWMQQGRQQVATADPGADTLRALDRRGRSIEAWREALRTILQQQEGEYRRAPITAQDLAQLLVSPHAPPERRIAAAFVLSQNQTATTEKQIRFAAESSSSQPMRIALRALADDRLEVDAIEEALAAETSSFAR